jgi:uncharacterized protein with NAD-binding domain and iron-sulfur cluster
MSKGTKGTTAPAANIVYVIGGGIAGLTAAQELVERDFTVHVLEKLARPFDANDCELGGLARTQWCSVRSDFAAPLGLRRAGAMMGSAPRWGEIFAREIAFARGSSVLSEESFKLVRHMAEELSSPRNAWTDQAPGVDLKQVWILVEGYALEGEASTTSPTADELRKMLQAPRFGGPYSADTMEKLLERTLRKGDTPTQRLSRCRAQLVSAAMTSLMKKTGVASTYSFHAVALGGVPRSFPDEPRQDSVVRLRPRDYRIPGEHGYRYFPAFYRHVMDTMKRIPVFSVSVPPRARQVREELELAGLQAKGRPVDPDEALAPLIRASNLTESPRTVFDNLVPTYQFAIATGHGERPLPVPRLLPRSFTAIKELVSKAFTQLGITPSDTLRFQTRLFIFMTSCERRRQTYEAVSWAQFIRADRCSERFQQLVERWPQALIGLQASLADARTVGTVTVQLLLDQVSATGFRDGTLNGPTTRAWLDPWRRYLEARGARFWRAEVQKLSLEGGRLKVDFRGQKSTDVPPDPNYVVLAVSPMEAKRLVKGLWDSCDVKTRDAFPRSLRSLLHWHLPEPGKHGGLPVEKAAPSGTLRHYSGVQFYFRSDLGPAQGHIYFADSDWRLSAISQIQFWEQGLLEGDAAMGGIPYISILSVDVGDWYAGPKGGRAVDCSREDFAKEVWRQVEAGLVQKGWTPPQPFAFHVDDDMLYEGQRAEHPFENLSPYPVNLAGDWDNHPGSVEGDAYEIFKGLVLAGAYVKTRTRLTTMESANESARRAVNGILDDYRRSDPAVSGRCQIWNPEENEVDDLGLLKDIDAALMERGLPHMLEILDVEKLLDAGPTVPSSAALLDAFLASSGPLGEALAAAGLPVRLLRAMLETLLV